VKGYGTERLSERETGARRRAHSTAGEKARRVYHTALVEEFVGLGYQHCTLIAAEHLAERPAKHLSA
jgi:hypothetical protein